MNKKNEDKNGNKKKENTNKKNMKKYNDDNKGTYQSIFSNCTYYTWGWAPKQKQLGLRDYQSHLI